MTTHGVIALIAMVILMWLKGPSFFQIDSFSRLLQSLLLGSLAGLAIQLIQWVARRFSKAIQKLSALLAQQFEGWNLKTLIVECFELLRALPSEPDDGLRMLIKPHAITNENATNHCY